MKKQFKLGIIGYGTVARNIIKGAVLSDFLHEKKIIVGVDGNEATEELDILGVRAVDDLRFVAENCEYLTLAVNPQEFENTIDKLRGFKPEKIISVMNGIKKNTVKNAFGLNAVRVARCIPNIPCAIGSGLTGIDMTDFNKNSDDTEFISNLFGCIGINISVDESKIDTISAISGPAITYMLIDSLISAGIKQGLTKNEAKLIALNAVSGAVDMVEHEDAGVSELLMQACNKNAAIEAVKQLEDNNFRSLISSAVEANINKIKERY